MNWQLCPWTLADLPQLADLEIRSHLTPSWTARHFAERYEQGDLGTVARSSAGEIMGFSVLWLIHVANEAHLLNLAVHPTYWRRGLGRQLLEHCLQQAQTHFADVIFLEVRDTNRAAQMLYETAGFHEIGRRKNYYPARPPHPAEDAIIMARALLRGVDSL